jgi:hypothetical protein
MIVWLSLAGRRNGRDPAMMAGAVIDLPPYILRLHPGVANYEAFHSRDGLVMDPLKLIALDKEDVAIVSAHLQDAIVKVADVHWRPAENRLVLAVGRFDWEAAQAPKPEYRRRLAALRFDRVMACRCRNVAQQQKDAVLNLLAVEFVETDAPAGIVTLVFSGGAALRLEVECIEAELADLGPAWTASARPDHSADPAPAGVDAQTPARH